MSFDNPKSYSNVSAAPPPPKRRKGNPFPLLNDRCMKLLVEGSWLWERRVEGGHSLGAACALHIGTTCTDHCSQDRIIREQISDVLGQALLCGRL